MKAMLIKKISDLNYQSSPLEYSDISDSKIWPDENEIMIKVAACGVCHTELDIIEGRTPPPSFPVIPGHQAVGIVIGSKAPDLFQEGDRAGVGWIYSSCGKCRFCLNDQENLCPDFLATGRDRNGGYAEYIIIRAAYAYKIPDQFTDTEAAPLLCAGAIGYRSVRLCNLKDGDYLGLTGFGASAHQVLQLVKFKYSNCKVFVFARSEKERAFALDLGADWSGDFSDNPPEKLNSIIDTTPVWKPIVDSLLHLQPGGRLVVNAIRKEDIDKSELLKINYPDHIWMEKEIKSVANVTRKDIKEFLDIAAEMKLKPEVQVYDLKDANKALLELKTRKVHGAKVLICS